MRKLFTLFFVVLFALCANAITYKIGDPGNNIQGTLTKDGPTYTFFDKATKVITFYAPCGYQPGWWLKDGSKAMDCSKWENFVLEIDNPNGVSVTAIVEYDAKGADGNPISSSETSNTDKVVVSLDPDNKDKVAQVFLQTRDEEVSETSPKSVTFKSAYFENSIEAPKTVAIWEGNVTLSWKEGGRVPLQAAAFENAKAGDVMTLCYSQFYNTWGQAQFNYGDWCESPTVNFNDKTNKDAVNFDKTLVPTEIYKWTFSDRETQVVLTQDILDNIKLHQQTYTEESSGYIVENVGIIIQGSDLVFTKVLIPETSAPTGISNAVVDIANNPNAPIFNLAGQKVSKAYKGVVIQNGKKFVQK